MWNEVLRNCSCQILPFNLKKILSVHQYLGLFLGMPSLSNLIQCFVKMSLNITLLL